MISLLITYNRLSYAWFNKAVENVRLKTGYEKEQLANKLLTRTGVVQCI
jgi:hypothetical protein